jgi:hypothetical protein
LFNEGSLEGPWGYMHLVRNIGGKLEDFLSRPLLKLLLRDIGFVYPVMSMMEIGPSLPILRQRGWSLLYVFIDST